MKISQLYYKNKKYKIYKGMKSKTIKINKKNELYDEFIINLYKLYY